MTSFADIQPQFDAYIGEIVYATMTTVDRKGRPRARVLIPVWETVDGRPLGWLATYKTPVKARAPGRELCTARSGTHRSPSALSP